MDFLQIPKKPNFQMPFIQLLHLAIIVEAIAICWDTIVTYLEGYEMPISLMHPCFMQVLVYCILVLVLRSLTVPLKCSFAKSHWRYEPLAIVVHQCDPHFVNNPFLRNVASNKIVQELQYLTLFSFFCLSETFVKLQLLFLAEIIKHHQQLFIY